MHVDGCAADKPQPPAKFVRNALKIQFHMAVVGNGAQGGQIPAVVEGIDALEAQIQAAFACAGTTDAQVRVELADTDVPERQTQMGIVALATQGQAAFAGAGSVVRELRSPAMAAKPPTPLASNTQVKCTDMAGLLAQAPAAAANTLDAGAGAKMLPSSGVLHTESPIPLDAAHVAAEADDRKGQLVQEGHTTAEELQEENNDLRPLATAMQLEDQLLCMPVVKTR